VPLNLALLKTLAVLIPVGMLCVGSAVTHMKERSFPSALQLVGAACLVMVILTHVCEALGLLPWMGWGNSHSAGHYLDLTSAVLGLSLLPLGYLLRTIHRRTPHAPPPRRASPTARAARSGRRTRPASRVAETSRLA
jgi:hypothetical protein